MVAGLERDVKRGARRARAGLLERDDLGVRAAGLLVPALTENFIFGSHHAAHTGIGGGRVQAARGEIERPPHHGVVESAEGAHFLRFFAAFTSCTASRKSSGDSKLR